jgi:(p)ppGpp synthase/HD superfamily hydrolase
MNEISNLVLRARTFAIAAHSAIGQKRKYTGEPYWVHCAEVADTVAHVAHTQEMLAAAWLHDVLEDTQVQPETIGNEFGEAVLDLVLWLTDVSIPSDGNRSTRKAIDRQHSGASPPGAQTIKLADLMSNTRSIVQHDSNFARVYLEEKSLLLDVLVKGDPIFQVNARAQLNRAMKLINGEVES